MARTPNPGTTEAVDDRTAHRLKAGSARDAVKATEKQAEKVIGNAGETMVAAQDRGYYGFTPDPTPNENYTVGGVTSGAPTPETDPALERLANARSSLPRNTAFVPANQEQFEEVIGEEVELTNKATARSAKPAAKAEAKPAAT